MVKFWKLALENNGPQLEHAGCQSKIHHTDRQYRALPKKKFRILGIIFKKQQQIYNTTSTYHPIYLFNLVPIHDSCKTRFRRLYKEKKKLFKLSNNKVVHLIQSLTNEEHVDAKQTTIKDI